ncbi:MAG: HIRAN domain-containing protein, partial [Gammaproteobacteria bacterium]
MMLKLYVFWQDQDTRRWHPVGILTRRISLYEFVYTKGAKDASGFVPFGRMNKLYRIYQSEELFPLFANRVLSRSRQEYDNYVRWIGADVTPDDKMLILARTGGARATDSLMIYAKPEPNERSEFDLFFLCHGVRYLPGEAIDRIARLKEGDALYPMLDVLNPFDANAVSLRT